MDICRQVEVSATTDHSFRGVLPTVVRRCVWSRNLVKMRSHTQSVVIEPNRRRIAGSISYKPLISDISVLIVCNKTGGTIKGDIKKLYTDNFIGLNFTEITDGPDESVPYGNTLLRWFNKKKKRLTFRPIWRTGCIYNPWTEFFIYGLKLIFPNRLNYNVVQIL